MSPSHPLRPPPPSRGQCGFTGASGQCQNPGRWDRDGVLSCTTHKNARNPIPFARPGGRQFVLRPTIVPERPIAVSSIRPEPTPVDTPRPSLSNSGIRKYPMSAERWWQKPLVACDNQAQPAELVILRDELQPGEAGAWMNSRGVATGATELTRDETGRYKTRRVPLPSFVSSLVRSMYERTGLLSGAPDLVIWDVQTKRVRFIEVKCPHWDKPSREQLVFLRWIESEGFPVKIVEWEFAL